VKPYASGKRWTLYQGDAMALIPQVGAVDAVVTDPPYSSGGMVRGDRAGASARSKYANSDSRLADILTGFSGDNRDQRSFLVWSSLWLGLCLDATPEGAPIVCFTDWRQLPTTTDAIQAGGWVWRGVVPWSKPSSRPQMGRFSASSEYAVWGTNGPSPDLVEVGCLPGHYVYSSPSGKEREHLTQKPVELMRAVVRICRPGGLVLDPFAGSGSTGVGALLEGRRFVGIEREAAHLATAARRLTDAESAGIERPLFGGAA
jgi:site-specific DNA-methyltransferase (adenine-specific)